MLRGPATTASSAEEASAVGSAAAAAAIGTGNGNSAVGPASSTPSNGTGSGRQREGVLAGRQAGKGKIPLIYYFIIAINSFESPFAFTLLLLLFFQCHFRRLTCWVLCLCFFWFSLNFTFLQPQPHPAPAPAHAHPAAAPLDPAPPGPRVPGGDVNTEAREMIEALASRLRVAGAAAGARRLEHLSYLSRNDMTDIRGLGKRLPNSIALTYKQD